MLSFPVMKTFHLILMYLLPILLFVLLLFRIFHILLLYENMFCFPSNILMLLIAYLPLIICFYVLLSSSFMHNLSIVSLAFFRTFLSLLRILPYIFLLAFLPSFFYYPFLYYIILIFYCKFTPFVVLEQVYYIITFLYVKSLLLFLISY